jgi:ParB-like chromosome segregation protein Spo0J
MSDTDPASDTDRFIHDLLPADPPPSAEIWVEEDRLPYDLSGMAPSPALIRLVERFGLPERVLVTHAEDDADGDWQVLQGAHWLRAAREAGMRRIPVRAMELSHLSAAFLALVLNQPWPADVAAQADALQVLLEAGTSEERLARLSGLGRGRLRRLALLLELHPTLRQALRDGRLRPQLAFAAAGLSEVSQQALADLLEEEGELSSADLRRVGGAGEATDDGEDGNPPEANAPIPIEASPLPEDPARRARRQAEELLRTLEEARIAGEIKARVAEVVEELRRVAR